MKHHIILKLHSRLPADLRILDWEQFIHDKSVIVERATPGVDRVLDEAGLAFWVTREYVASADGWTDEEVRYGLDRTYRLVLHGGGRPTPATVAALAALPEVESARALATGEVPLPPPEVSLAAGLGRGRELIHLDRVRTHTRGHPDVTVAVLDTGVEDAHPELRGRLSGQADFVHLEGLDTRDFVGDTAEVDAVAADEIGHGTHVAGIVGGRGLQMDEGVAPSCRLLAVRVLATMRKDGRVCGAGIVDNINTGIKWAVDRGADVVNMSLGIRHEGGGLPHADVIRYALSRGTTVVAASGNDGTAARYYPGALPGVIAVGAVDDTGRVAPFSSYGARITVVAPGVAVHSCATNGGYMVASGTSQAAPFVAGAVALLKSLAREQGFALGHADLLDVLRHTSDRVDARWRSEHAGYGVLNLADAVAYLTHSSS